MNPAVLSLLGYAAGGGVEPPVEPTQQVAGGRGDNAKRALVEIDGELFPDRDVQQARELLEAAKELARSTAQEAAKRATARAIKARAPVVAPVPPRVVAHDVSHQVWAMVDAANAAIARIYEEAMDDEVPMLLLTGML